IQTPRQVPSRISWEDMVKEVMLWEHDHLDDPLVSIMALHLAHIVISSGTCIQSKELGAAAVVLSSKIYRDNYYTIEDATTKHFNSILEEYEKDLFNVYIKTAVGSEKCYADIVFEQFDFDHMDPPMIRTLNNLVRQKMVLKSFELPPEFVAADIVSEYNNTIGTNMAEVSSIYDDDIEV